MSQGKATTKKGTKRPNDEAAEAGAGSGGLVEAANKEASISSKDSDIAKDIVEVMSKFDDDLKFKDALKFLFSRGLPLGLFVRGADTAAPTKAAATASEEGADDSNGDQGSAGISGNSSAKESRKQQANGQNTTEATAKKNKAIQTAFGPAGLRVDKLIRYLNNAWISCADSILDYQNMLW
jgi:hypothetical protein